ncbi:MAG: hypothetical protein WDN04_21105 [Rhodospirillales bacterium]
MRISMSRADAPPRWRVAALAGLGLLIAATAITPASAWWRGGVWIGVPPIVVGPAYYPPPYYYPPAYYPPPVYYPPPAGYPQPAPQASGTAQAQPQHPAQSQAPVVYGSMCYAGVYSCPAAAKSPVGGVCSCPGLGAPSFGTVN